MTIPIYDRTVLPCITFPMSNTREGTQRYLGARAVTGGFKAEINIIAKTDAEVNALELFHRNDCNNGLEPFIIQLPLFGRPTTVNLLAMFTGSSVDSKNEVVSNLKRSIKVLGIVVYTIDSNGDFILSDEGGHFTLDDAGNYIALMSQTQIYKEISYAFS